MARNGIMATPTTMEADATAWDVMEPLTTIGEIEKFRPAPTETIRQEIPSDLIQTLGIILPIQEIRCVVPKRVHEIITIRDSVIRTQTWIWTAPETTAFLAQIITKVQALLPHDSSARERTRQKATLPLHEAIRQVEPEIILPLHPILEITAADRITQLAEAADDLLAEADANHI